MHVRIPLHLLLFLLFFMNGCAYHLGNSTRNLPGGYRQLSIPIFENKTLEPGIETYFTSALSQEFHRSKVGKIVDVESSELKLLGEVASVVVVSTVKKASGDTAVPYLPNGAVLTTAYKVTVRVNVRIVRQSDQSVVWQGSFDGDRTYSGASVSLAGINSVNPLYNLSAKRQNIQLLANDLMAEAYDRITENF